MNTNRIHFALLLAVPIIVLMSPSATAWTDSLEDQGLRGHSDTNESIHAVGEQAVYREDRLPTISGSRHNLSDNDWHATGLLLNAVIDEVNSFVFSAPDMDDATFFANVELFCGLANREANGYGYSNLALSVSVKNAVVYSVIKRISLADGSSPLRYLESLTVCTPVLDADHLQAIEVSESRHGDWIGTVSLDGYSNKEKLEKLVEVWLREELGPDESNAKAAIILHSWASSIGREYVLEESIPGLVGTYFMVAHMHEVLRVLININDTHGIIPTEKDEFMWVAQPAIYQLDPTPYSMLLETDITADLCWRVADGSRTLKAEWVVGRAHVSKRGRFYDYSRED